MEYKYLLLISNNDFGDFISGKTITILSFITNFILILLSFKTYSFYLLWVKGVTLELTEGNCNILLLVIFLLISIEFNGFFLIEFNKVFLVFVNLFFYYNIHLYFYY